jgi:hypothetical protein
VGELDPLDDHESDLLRSERLAVAGDAHRATAGRGARRRPWRVGSRR